MIMAAGALPGTLNSSVGTREPPRPHADERAPEDEPAVLDDIANSLHPAVPQIHALGDGAAAGQDSDGLGDAEDAQRDDRQVETVHEVDLAEGEADLGRRRGRSDRSQQQPEQAGDNATARLLPQKASSEGDA